MSKDKPFWKENVPVWTDKGVLEDLFIEAHERLISDKFEPRLNAAWENLKIASIGNKQALRRCAEIATIYTEILYESCVLLAALAPHLACKPLSHETLLTNALDKGGLPNLANEKQGGMNDEQERPYLAVLSVRRP